MLYLYFLGFLNNITISAFTNDKRIFQNSHCMNNDASLTVCIVLIMLYNTAEITVALNQNPDNTTTPQTIKHTILKHYCKCLFHSLL